MCSPPKPTALPSSKIRNCSITPWNWDGFCSPAMMICCEKPPPGRRPQPEQRSRLPSPCPQLRFGHGLLARRITIGHGLPGVRERGLVGAGHQLRPQEDSDGLDDPFRWRGRSRSQNVVGHRSVLPQTAEAEFRASRDRVHSGLSPRQRARRDAALFPLRVGRACEAMRLPGTVRRGWAGQGTEGEHEAHPGEKRAPSDPWIQQHAD